MSHTPSHVFSAFDKAMMQLALRQAQRGLGTTAPNPSVGAVVANEATGEIIATGVTQAGGRPHAEAEALKKAGARARGATIYVTLEPCAFTGRNPTCADQILTAGLKRVVAAQFDPNAIIAGRGFDQIREAGIRVDVGLFESDAQLLTRGHILRQTFKRPSVKLKLAVSRDGRIAPGDGQPVWVTGPVARAHAHLLRAEADAIIVGIKTILADDPTLTCRLPGLEQRSPQRVIIDNLLRTPPNAKALARTGSKPVLIATVLGPDACRASELNRAGIEILSVSGAVANEPQRMVDLSALLTNLAARGVTRTLVEGGPTIATNFLDAGLVDEIALFESPNDLGASGVKVEALARINAVVRMPGWTLTEDRSVGHDRLRTYARTM